MARKWVEEAIPATSNLDTQVILLHFFGHDIYSEIRWLGAEHICQPTVI